ncbi:uncharacterized protein DUF4383 [Glaciihabitans tibetensis]|uniref:Uncharacterized protein DUF4383 n=1 Tax=Glaciihabitans tibetensis TaxID=1266600 RepID=A0A2T0VCX1_9MICO|nr:DUF4383 domain-containing protein [Glaciihabitans tibetensis]PRY68018.1 uncharacterized protein DUF4383 [Glaciihabitans tibetensis]
MSRSPNRLIGVIVGAGYTLLGFVGLTVTLGSAPGDTVGGLLLGTLAVNTVHTLTHVLLGAALLLAGLSSVPAARRVNIVVGTVCLALGIAGLFLVGTPNNLLAVNAAGNVLHFGSAVLLLAVGLGAEKADRVGA